MPWNSISSKEVREQNFLSEEIMSGESDLYEEINDDDQRLNALYEELMPQCFMMNHLISKDFENNRIIIQLKRDAV